MTYTELLRSEFFGVTRKSAIKQAKSLLNKVHPREITIRYRRADENLENLVSNKQMLAEE